MTLPSTVYPAPPLAIASVDFVSLTGGVIAAAPAAPPPVPEAEPAAPPAGVDPPEPPELLDPLDPAEFPSAPALASAPPAELGPPLAPVAPTTPPLPVAPEAPVLAAPAALTTPEPEEPALPGPPPLGSSARGAELLEQPSKQQRANPQSAILNRAVCMGSPTSQRVGRSSGLSVWLCLAANATQRLQSFPHTPDYCSDWVNSKRDGNERRLS